jgi:hypothetical protein
MAVCRDIFVMEHTAMLFWKFSLRRMQAGTFFPTIGKINIPLSNRILCHRTRSVTFLRKIALAVRVMTSFPSKVQAYVTSILPTVGNRNHFKMAEVQSC